MLRRLNKREDFLIYKIFLRSEDGLWGEEVAHGSVKWRTLSWAVFELRNPMAQCSLLVSLVWVFLNGTLLAFLIQAVRSLLARSSLSIPELSSDDVLGSLFPMVCNLLVVSKVSHCVLLTYWIQNFLCFEFYPLHFLCLFLSVLLHFLCSPPHESHFSGCNFRSVFWLHCPVFSPI